MNINHCKKYSSIQSRKRVEKTRSNLARTESEYVEDSESDNTEEAASTVTRNAHNSPGASPTNYPDMPPAQEAHASAVPQGGPAILPATTAPVLATMASQRNTAATSLTKTVPVSPTTATMPSTSAGPATPSTQPLSSSIWEKVSTSEVEVSRYKQR